eukprot:2950750-Prymnesium_polylepis.1
MARAVHATEWLWSKRPRRSRVVDVIVLEIGLGPHHADGVHVARVVKTTVSSSSNRWTHVARR